MGRARTTATALGRVVRRFGREVFADQVREGRLHTRGLSLPVRIMSRMGLTLFWVVAALALVSAVLGLHYQKELASGVVDLLLAVCLGFLNVCVQPMARGWRTAGLVLSATSMIPQMVLLVIMIQTGGASPISLLGWLGIAVLACSLGVLVALTVMRRGMQTWRLWLAGAVGGVGHLTAMVIAWGFPFARSVNELSMLITDVVLLYVAVPLAAASGISFAQIATNVAAWSVLSVRDLLSPAVWVVAAALTSLAALAMAVLAGPSALGGIAASVGYTLVSAALAAAGLRAVGRPADVPRPTSLTAELAAKGALFAGLLCSWLLLLPAAVIPGNPLRRAPLGLIGDLATAAVTVVLWRRAIRRRASVMTVMAPGIFCACLYAGARLLLRHLKMGSLPVLSSSATGGVLVIVAICQAVVWARRGAFSPDRDRARWAIVTMIAVEALVFPWRESMAEPLETVVQGSAVAVLLVGLVWRVLTEAEYTHGSSAGFPAQARALFFVSQALLAAVFVLQTVILPDSMMSGAIDLNQWASIVDSTVGHGLQVGVAVGLLALGRWRVDPMDPADAVEEAAIVARRRTARRLSRRPAREGS